MLGSTCIEEITALDCWNCSAELEQNENDLALSQVERVEVVILERIPLSIAHSDILFKKHKTIRNFLAELFPSPWSAPRIVVIKRKRKEQ